MDEIREDGRKPIGVQITNAKLSLAEALPEAIQYVVGVSWGKIKGKDLDSRRLEACHSIIDRCLGKPRQQVGVDAENLPTKITFICPPEAAAPASSST